MLHGVKDEFEAIYSLKEANSQTFMQLQDDMHNLQHGEASFVETMILAARANPQNVSLQKTCIEALIFRDRNRSLNQCIEFLAETMDAHADCERLLEISCKAVVHLVEHFAKTADVLRQKGFMQRLANVIVEHSQEEPMRRSACSALLALLLHSDDARNISKLSEVTESVQDFMQNGVCHETRNAAFDLLRTPDFVDATN